MVTTKTLMFQRVQTKNQSRRLHSRDAPSAVQILKAFSIKLIADGNTQIIMYTAHPKTSLRIIHANKQAIEFQSKTCTTKTHQGKHLLETRQREHQQSETEMPWSHG